MYRMRPSIEFESRMGVASALERVWKEKRADARQLVWVYGHISVAGVAETIVSTVRDISEGGCRIELDSAADLPTRFWIEIEGHSNARTCDVVWRSGNHLGVKFLS